MPALLQSSLPFPVRRGKVRDVYDLGDRLLLVATDRISAFDVIMPNGIPDKGAVLTALSRFWFGYFSDVENHLLDGDLPSEANAIADRSTLARKARVIPIECVVRGYLAGSGWKEYQQAGTVGGMPLRPGYRQCEQLDEPLFSPATKEEHGHDVNVSFDHAADLVGPETAEVLRGKSLDVYRRAAEYGAARGVIIADTKFEFGLYDDRIILIDEVLTPDSSRFWPADQYQPGLDQPSFDKQFVRNWLETQPWDKTAPAPMLPEPVVAGTADRYKQAYRLLTGRPFGE